MAEKVAPIRIALFMPSFERGGVERTVVNLATGFLDYGWHVDLVISRTAKGIFDQIPNGVNVVKLGNPWKTPGIPKTISSRAWTSMGSLFGFCRYLRKIRPDMVLVAQSSVVASWARALSRTKVPLVLRENVVLSTHTRQDQHWMAKLNPLLKRWSYSRVEGIIAVSEGVADDLAKMINLPRQKITVIYNPTVQEGLQTLAQDPIAHPWFNQGQPPVILGAGRLVPQKDFPTLLRAFALARRRLTARLVILGDGVERDDLLALANELGIAEDLDLPGFVQNPYQYMARSSLFVMTSAWEGLPNSLIEAMALGTSVISTDCPSGPYEILRGGSLGPLVPVGDHHAVADAIVKLLDDKEVAANFVREATLHLDRFRPAKVLGQYIAVLKEAQR